MGWLNSAPRRAARQAQALTRFADRDGKRADLQVRALLGATVILANLAGAVLVFVLAVWVLPTKEIRDPTGQSLLNLSVALGYVGLATVIGYLWGVRRLAPARHWLIDERVPSPEEQRSILRAPIYLFKIQLVFWGFAALLFGGLNLVITSFELGQRVATTVILGGLGTAGVVYLLSERLLRPLAARALTERPLDRPAVPGIASRSIFAWGLGTALPVVGLMAIGLSSLIQGDFSRDELAVAVLAVGGVAVTLGFVVSLLTARSTADPVNALRIAMDEVGEGDFEASVDVYDGAEIGLLQSGFNRMAGGLRERERIRDVFGRHVGEEVAGLALDGEVEMGGEVRQVAVLFADMVGSTTIAAERPPDEVVDLLNTYFAVVVDVVTDQGGWINKFQGDAALAVFGAPRNLPDAPDRALGAARILGSRLAEEVPGASAGIGVSFGPAVAGNIGESRRYEYTVIGDAVNEASRLTELAKDTEARVLAGKRAVEAASEDEARRWEAAEELVLRGRSEPTQTYAPTVEPGVRSSS